MNKFFVIGNLTKDPESRVTSNGKDVCNFTVAVKRRYGADAQFIKVAMWGALAQNCQTYLSKGSKVALLGEASIEVYSGKDGSAKGNLVCNAETVEFLNRVNKDEQAAEKAMENDIAGLDFEDIGF